jgi:signal transduction histidine kinase
MYMLKILGKNSKLPAETPRRFSKLYGALATGLKDKYWQDPFAKSEIKVIALQISFALLIFGIAAFFFNYIYQDVLKTIIAGIAKGIESGHFNGEDVTDSLEIAKSNRFVIFATITFMITAIFTYVVIKITLKPAKSALDLQKRFISDIAHELRTPLSIIKTNGEVALMEDNLDSKVKEMIKSNIEELDRMSVIINNVLSFNSLIKPGKIIFSDVDMGAVIDSAVSKLKDLAQKKNQEITIQKITPHTVWGNAVALEQIIVNLLKNSINYSGERGFITIRVGPDYAGNTIINVEDTGMGITKNDLLHIFEPFYKSERSRNRKHSSSGLGLTIVSELVKMHSGRITIRSAENKGTIVSITLPRKNNESEKSIDFADLNEVSVNFFDRKRKRI